MANNNMYSIDKLDEKNYDVWCVQMRSVLVHSEVWKITSGVELKPEEDNGNWIKKDEKALASITLSVKPNQLNYIKNCQTSAEAWQRLKEIHEPSGPARKVSLYKTLLGLRLSEGANVVLYVNEFESVIDKLKEVGVSLGDEIIVIILLSSLPKSYENFVIAMEIRDELPNFTIMRNKLLEEADRRNQTKSECSEQQAYMIKNKTNRDKEGKRNNNDGKCFVCGKRGHYAASCRQNKFKDKQRKEEETIKQEKRNKNEQSFVCVSPNIALFSSNQSVNCDVWCVDSGATSHMCNNRALFHQYTEIHEKVLVAGDQSLNAIGIGTVHIKTKNSSFNLKNVLHVPDLQVNFFSVGKGTENGLQINFNSKCAIVKIKTDNELIAIAKRDKGLYYFENIVECVNMTCVENVIKWHNRFGHLNIQSLHRLASNEMVQGIDKIQPISNITCVSCMKSKICSQPFNEADYRAKNLLEIVHSDVCGPFNTNSIGGSKYFLTFIDDKSRYATVIFMQNKSEVFEHFKKYKQYVEKQTGAKIKVIRSDNGGEYVNKEFDQYLQSQGIERQLTVPHTPQQNGVAERFNRTLVEMARSMLLHAGLEEKFWAEACACALYIRNRSTTRALEDATPFEIWFQRKPTVKHFRTFGCLAVGLDKTQKQKFRAKGREYIFVGYSTATKGYRLYDIDQHKVVIKRDVKFQEWMFMENKNRADFSDMIYKNNCQADKESQNVSADKTINTNCSASPQIDYEDAEAEPNHMENIPESSNDEEQLPKYGPGRPRIVRTGAPGRPAKQKNRLNVIQTTEEVKVPENVTAAINDTHSSKWKEAMQLEFNSLVANNTWSLVDLPANKKTIGNKWVFSLKRDAEGNIERYKARLVAKGCSQQYGVNYEETYSPVVRYATIRMVFALAAELQLYMHQMDICTAYLNGELSDEIYMVQPEMFINKRHPNKVAKLNKAIYGLKQSGREWNVKLDNALKKFGFISCSSEPCLYTKLMDNNINIIAVYVDDILIASKNKADLEAIKQYIGKQFKSVDKGEVNNFLGFSIERTEETGDVFVCQTNYIDKLLNQYNMQSCKSAATPLDAGYQINPSDESKKVDATKYQTLIGSLMYLAISTRPDILHSVCKLSQMNKNPNSTHEAGAKHILRYLSSTKNMKLHYYKTGKSIEGYTDADWGGNIIDRKSFTGFIFFLAGAAFSWESHKQTTVALSSTEAEYMALAAAAKEAVYLRRLVNEIGCFSTDLPICVYGDNISAQQLAKNHMYHARSKHIDIRYHFIRELVETKEIVLKYIDTSNMIADICTKNLSKQKHVKLLGMTGLKILKN